MWEVFCGHTVMFSFQTGLIKKSVCWCIFMFGSIWRGLLSHLLPDILSMFYILPPLCVWVWHLMSSSLTMSAEKNKQKQQIGLTCKSNSCRKQSRRHLMVVFGASFSLLPSGWVLWGADGQGSGNQTTRVLFSGSARCFTVETCKKVIECAHPFTHSTNC